ncbi:MAG: PAS domain S-box protein, partial [Spirochaetia bacterium]|nr:PAS domain S-box protein [Spirochaetia bacterium]
EVEYDFQKEHIYADEIQSSVDGFLMVDLNGYLLEVNNTYVYLSGYNREELLSMRLQDLDAGESSDEIKHHIDKILCQKYDRFETSHRKKNGILWSAEIVATTKIVSGGTICMFIIDITERKNITGQNTLMEQVFQNSVEAMMITDEQNRIINVNPSFSAMTGYSKEEILGKDPKILSSGKELSEFYDAMWKSLNTDHFWQGEILDRRKNGAIYPKWLAIVAVLNGKNKITNYIASFIDITERKKIEEDLEQRVKERTEDLNRINESLVFANHSKDSFLAAMSHEIRTPLSGMLGMLELLNLSSLDNGQRNTLQIARDSGKSLLRILNDVLDWSKIEEGKLVLSPQTTSHASLIQQVVSTYSHVARTTGLILRHRIDPQISPRHMVDFLRISQILSNFVSNAIKFTRNGEVEIWDELIEKKDDVELVRFSVRDTGIGIDKDIQEQLFYVYGQVMVKKQRMYGGTGLGLSICRRLADLMNGKIEIISSPGKGSTFSLVLSMPIHKDPEESPPHGSGDDPPESLNKERLSHLKVLVVDDNPINLTLLVRQVELLGLGARSADDGWAALKLWREEDFCLVITDCHMPKMNGYELSAAIRHLESEQNRNRVPIIACTANALSEENELCHAAGMDEVMVKPVNLPRLRSSFSRWLPQVLNESGHQFSH